MCLFKACQYANVNERVYKNLNYVSFHLICIEGTVAEVCFPLF
jgi:hypothetical protein